MCKQQKGCYGGHKQIGIITHNKILVDKLTKGVKHIKNSATLNNLFLQKRVFLNIKNKNNFKKYILIEMKFGRYELS